MDRGAWQDTVHRFTKSQTRLKRLTMHVHLKMVKMEKFILRVFHSFSKRNHFPLLFFKPALLFQFPISVSGTIPCPAVQARNLALSLAPLSFPPPHTVIQQTHMDPPRVLRDLMANASKSISIPKALFQDPFSHLGHHSGALSQSLHEWSHTQIGRAHV